MQADEKQQPSLRNMVEMAGLKFESKFNSGMDDVNNMAKLLLRMTADGLSGIMPNEVLDLSLGPPYYSLYKGKTIDQGDKRLERLQKVVENYFSIFLRVYRVWPHVVP